MIPDFLKSLRNIGNGLQDLLFPPTCLHCQSIIKQQGPLPNICPQCLHTLKPMPGDFARNHILNRIKPQYIDQLWIAFQFTETIRALLHSIKYQKTPELGRRLGAFAAPQIEKEIEAYRADLVLPVPLHPIRKKEREYNQSAFIAAGIFAGKGVRVSDHLLRRIRHTSSQTRLNRRSRRLNVKDAFDVRQIPMVEGKNTILVDDVVTTGATMNECARRLKECGAASVVGIALASPVEEG